MKYYRDPITLKWRETYLAYYNKRIKKDPRLTDAEEIEQRVQDNIRSDLRAGRLDITVAASAVEGENKDGKEVEDQDGEGGEDQDGQDSGGQDGEEDEGKDGEDQDGKEDEDQDGEEGENQDGEEGEENQDGQEDEDQAEEDAELFSDEVSVNLPKVTIWYQNAVMKNIWEKASLSQRDVVEQYKTKDDIDDMGDVGDASMEDDKWKVKRLQNLIKFVASPI